MSNTIHEHQIVMRIHRQVHEVFQTAIVYWIFGTDAIVDMKTPCG